MRKSLCASAHDCFVSCSRLINTVWESTDMSVFSRYLPSFPWGIAFSQINLRTKQSARLFTRRQDINLQRKSKRQILVYEEPMHLRQFVIIPDTAKKMPVGGAEWQVKISLLTFQLGKEIIKASAEEHTLLVWLYIYIYIYIYIYMTLWLECSPIARKARVQSYIAVCQRLQKWYLMLPWLTLNIIKHRSRVKWGSWGKGVVPFFLPCYSS